MHVSPCETSTKAMTTSGHVMHQYFKQPLRSASFFSLVFPAEEGLGNFCEACYALQMLRPTWHAQHVQMFSIVC